MFYVKIILNLVIISSVLATKLNYPRVLLPIFDKVSVNFTLDVIEKGCYKWTSSRNDLIQLSTEFDENLDRCSSRVTVSVITKEKHRNTAIVLAENLSSGEVIRCDVILDVIDQLAVLTTTRELYLEEAPETFELIAQDSQGNAFTTLEGIEFAWSISTENKNRNDENWTQVLRFLKFSESKYHETPKTVERIENAGLKGYMVLLEGINTGSAKVTVRLPYTEYSHVASIEVDIMVLANIILDPSEAAILVGDTIDFRVLQLKQGKLQEIALNSQYFLEIEDISYAKIEGRTATGLKLGRTIVTLRDRNVPSDKSTEAINSFSPRSTLTIANAVKIGLSLLPFYNWVTVEEERHEIAVDLYTRDDQRITLGTKYKVDSTFNSDNFYKISRTRNGSRIYGEAVQESISSVTGTFEKLHAENELLIYKKLTLEPKLVILPFDPNFPTRHRVQFVATGGDGQYVWSSANTQLVSISKSGIAETKLDIFKKAQTQQLENINLPENLVKLTNIKVSLAKNNFISRSAEILFLTPVKLEIVQYNFETPLRDYVKVHVALYTMYNETLMPFTLCDNVNFDLDFSSQIFVEDTTKASNDNEKLSTNACRIYYLKSTNLGTTNLKISYKFNNKILKDEVNLVVFERLVIFNPVENEIVLPIGSSRNVIYKNGPTKMYTFDTELTKSLGYDRSIIGVDEFTPASDEFSASVIGGPKEKHVYTILCRKVGETTFKFDIYNVLPNARNSIPFISTYETKVHCVKPRYINFYTSAKIKEGCPMERRKSLIHVNSQDNDVEVDIEVLDEAKRVISNVTSLVMDWKFFIGDKLTSNALSYRRDVDDDWVEGVPIPRRTFLKTVLPDANMNVKIKGTIVSYDGAVLNKFSIKPESPQFGIRKTATGPLVTPTIENELNFYAVDNTLLPFDSISLYLTKRRPERVPISQGSGAYELTPSESGIVMMEYDATTRQLVLNPIRVGDLRIDILDRCLMTEPAHLYVSVVSIERIVIEMADRVEKSKSIEAIVKLYDAKDRLIRLDSDALEIYELSEEVYNPNLINIRLGSQENLGIGEIRYIVNGMELGEAKIIVNSGKMNVISSNAAPIQVFSPLKLYPRNETIYVGSSVQIYSVGGPSPDVNIIYSVMHEDIARMESSIVTGTKIGETIVTGRCVGVNPSTGNQIVFSEDFVTIRVIPLDKIKIKVPLLRLKAGATIPAAVWGVPNISPIIVGTLNPLRIQWTTNQPDVIEISGVFADAGIEYGDEDSISIRVKGLNPGKALLHATVITPSGIRLKSSVEISVFKILELESPKKISSDAILIAPKSEIQLKTNLEDTSYELETDSGSSSSCVVRVTRNGYVSATEAIGRSLIIATSADQTLPIPIEVKNIHYILASLHPSNLKLNSVERKIPLGFNLLLRVTLHDNLGNEFSHSVDGVNLLTFNVARKDMIDIHIGQNLSVNLNLLRETSNMLAISLKDSSGVKYAADYLKLAVGPSQFVFPTMTTFSVGDVICFGSHVDTSSKWFSADDKIVSVNEETGVAQVIGTRNKHGDKVSVYQGEKSKGSLKFDLEIRDADKIEFLKPYDIINGNLYQAYLIIKNHIQTDKHINLIGKNLTICAAKLDTVKTSFFTCKLVSRQSANNIYLQHFRVVPMFDKNLGLYACEVTLKLGFNELLQYNDVNFELEARLQNGVFATLPLRIAPGITVTPNIINVDQIVAQGITVSGLEKTLQHVKVVPSESSALVLAEIKRSPESNVYKFKLLREITDDDQISIQITSPLTDQVIDVLVQSSESSLKCSQRSHRSNIGEFISKFGLIISSVIVILFTITIFIFCLQKSQPADNQIFLSPSKNKGGGGGTSPIGSPTPIAASSPYDVRGSNVSHLQKTPELSPIYGDTSFASPNRRLHRRFL